MAAESLRAAVTDQQRAGRKRDRDAGWTRQFEGQMLVCGFLAKVLHGAPDRPWLDALIANDLLGTVPFGANVADTQDAARRLHCWTTDHRGGLDECAFAQLCADYTQLFVGPGKLTAAPWESVYANRDRAVFQRETVSVRNWYRRFGLDLDSDYNQPADHVGIEFGFLSYLAQATLHASQISDGDQVKRLVAAQRGFIGQHMRGWIGRWAVEVSRHAKTEFFRAVALLATGTLAEAQSFFAVPLPEASASGPFRIAQV